MEYGEQKFSKVNMLEICHKECENIFINSALQTKFLKPKISVISIQYEHKAHSDKSQLGLYNKGSLNFKRNKYINCDLWTFCPTCFM